MKFRLNTARLLVATYGNSFTPDSMQPLHLEAELLSQSLAGKPDFQSVFDKQVATWGADFAGPRPALHQALFDLGGALAAAFPSHQFELKSLDAQYRPIYDSNNKEVGHDTVSWIYQDDKSVFVELKDDDGCFTNGLVGCVFVSVAEATVVSTVKS